MTGKELAPFALGGFIRVAEQLDDGDAIVDLRNAAHAANLFQMLKAHLK